jgi:hypothetical protein
LRISGGGGMGSAACRPSVKVHVLARDVALDPEALCAPVRHQLVQGDPGRAPRRQAVVADLGALLDDGELDLAERGPGRAGGGCLVVARDQVRQVERAGQVRRAGADEQDVDFEDLALAHRALACAWWRASSQRSASIAAMQPEPAAVIAWR